VARDAPHRYDLGVFSAGSLMEALGVYIAAYLYGYKISSQMRLGLAGPA
jgi:hypothetical protein